MAGYVYILSNPSFPALLKIGKTERDPTEYRISELYTTGVPSPFKVEYYAFVKDHHRLEKVIHSRLSSLRHNTSREFFSVSVEEAVLIIRQCDELISEKLFCKTEKEIKKEIEKRGKEEEIKKRKIEQEKAEAKRKIDEENERIKKEEGDKNKWSESLSIAENIIKSKRKNFIELHAKTSAWKYYFITISVLSLPTIFLSAETFLIIAFANALGLLPFFWMGAKSSKESAAFIAYPDTLIKKVAELHYYNKDYEDFLLQILRNKILRN
jgi:hypothetical protein